MSGQRGSLYRVVVVSLVLLSVLGPARAAVPQDRESDHSEQSVAVLDGRTLYKAIFFAVGPVAEQFVPERARVAAQRGVSADSYDGFLERIEAERPGYFDEFARTLSSGRHVAIDLALRSGADLLAETFEHEYGVDLDSEYYRETLFTLPPFLAFVLAIAVAGVLFWVAAANGFVEFSYAAAHVDVKVWDVCTEHVCKANGAELRYDLLVDQLAVEVPRGA